MRCPFCKEDNDKVIDSRSSEGGRVIRRRRECIVTCERRFTTYEKIGESFKLNVVKKGRHPDPLRPRKSHFRACKILLQAPGQRRKDPGYCRQDRRRNLSPFRQRSLLACLLANRPCGVCEKSTTWPIFVLPASIAILPTPTTCWMKSVRPSRKQDTGDQPQLFVE